MKYLRFLLLLAFLTATETSLSQTIDSSLLRNSPKVMQAFREVVARPNQATVRVLANGKEVALGTVVEADGWVLTKASELKGKVACKMKDGKVLEAKIVGIQEPFDLALLKIDAGGLPTVEWSDSTTARVGSWVASAGPGMDPVAVGVVSVATRKFQPGDQPPKNNMVSAGWLGVSLEEAGKGAKIASVAPNSPARKAGLKVNDIVVKAAGRNIIDTESLINTIQRFKPGDQVTLKIKRGKEDLEFNATLAKFPKQLLGNPQETMGTTLSNRRGGFPFILQHDSGLRPMDCGGPLVDLDGKAVGINISRAGRTETYAIPSEEVRRLLGELKSGKLAPKDHLAEVEPLPKNPNLILRSASGLETTDPPSKLRAGAFQKVHEVQFSAGVTYIIELTSNEFDTYLYLENAAGKRLAEDDDSGGNRHARIEFRAPGDGVYRLLVTSLGPNEVGAYTLTVHRLPGTKK